MAGGSSRVQSPKRGGDEEITLRSWTMGCREDKQEAFEEAKNIGLRINRD
jgi:hypothetical protein